MKTMFESIQNNLNKKLTIAYEDHDSEVQTPRLLTAPMQYDTKTKYTGGMHFANILYSA